MRRIIKFALRKVPRHVLHRIAPLAGRLISPVLRGNRYEDPFTGITYRRLLPYGRVSSRNNALAPDSLSLERHRLLWLYLKRETDFFSKDRSVLHMAPEDCFRQRFRRMPNLDYTTADLNSPWADIHCDVSELPFEDGRFDVVLCNHVLEHVEDDARAMAELFRVMRPGGFGIFQVPIDPKLATTFEDPSITDPVERERHYGQSDHLRQYGRDYADKLASVGFRVVENDFASRLRNDEVERYCVSPDEVIYVGHKPSSARAA